jgi:hypothetical protein
MALATTLPSMLVDGGKRRFYKHRAMAPIAAQTSTAATPD